MGYRRNWRFDEDCAPPSIGGMTLNELIKFTEWQKREKEEQDKKQKEVQKKTHWGKEWSKKEIALNMFLLSPLIGIPVALMYIAAFKTMINMMSTIVR